ncbi:aminodeoxychorismate synthase component I [Porphyromonas sp.]|uniref:aminodeoxychorismate synthase component I n=1 Tax=Porphyromonas sp. TaxID=1924944 RepID=UPI0026DB232F|nr:aminodeoxychorismate synthase component I [Porphyromonas sp.]MDO4695315.1 aminodeoxychorismate synthase component I [Porphyromonas sp.]MDO4771022.1 aminodeoxychorismate synthase component I [Porphyromonas sp.]
MCRVREKSYQEVITQLNEYGEKKKTCLFIIDFEQNKGYIVEEPLKQKDILFSINKITNSHQPQKLDLSLKSYPIPYKTYRHKFDIVCDGLKRGDTFLCNLTVSTPVETEASLEEIYHATEARYKVCIPDRFVCFSPEIFITIDAQGQVASHPMKGTIDASIPNAEEIILNDYKETAEHNTIVDLIRNDLNIVSEFVDVERFRYIDKIQLPNGRGLLQVSSKVIGMMPKDYHSSLGTVIDQLLPAGSISGAPKDATIRIIKSAEDEPRGYYTGIVGYYDGKTLDTGVLIRFIEKRGKQMYFRSGGGITINSDPKEEYNEVIQKVYIPLL